MAAILEPPRSAGPHANAPVPWYLASVALASTLVIVGLLWDISWHRTIGRDAFLTPAHVAIYLGALVAGCTCGALALLTTFGSDRSLKSSAVKFWGFARRWAPGCASGAASRCSSRRHSTTGGTTRTAST